MLQKIQAPGLFITGTDTGVGKTVVAGAIASWFRDQAGERGARVGVCKIAATGCERRREGLVSEDAELLAFCADSEFPLNLICPQCYGEPLAPAVAAERANEPWDESLLERSLNLISKESDVMIVEGVGGLMVPMDREQTVLDLAKKLQLPVLIVARPGLGTLNHTLLTIAALRSAQLTIAGVVINRYPAEAPGAAEETNPAAIERWGKVPVLCLVPDEPFKPPRLPAGVAAAIARVDWATLVRHS